MEQFQNPVRTVEEEMSREQKFWKRNQLWTVLVAMVVLFGLLGGNSLSVAPGAEELTLIMHDDSAQTIRYDAIAELELLEDADYGVMHQGKDTRQGKSGTWEHPDWGSYTLCTYASCDRVVRITTEDRCYVVNLPSEEETDQLYQLIQDKMPESR
jgi:hypothetical protein